MTFFASVYNGSTSQFVALGHRSETGLKKSPPKGRIVMLCDGLCLQPASHGLEKTNEPICWWNAEPFDIICLIYLWMNHYSFWCTFWISHFVFFTVLFFPAFFGVGFWSSSASGFLANPCSDFAVSGLPQKGDKNSMLVPGSCCQTLRHPTLHILFHLEISRSGWFTPSCHKPHAARLSPSGIINVRQTRDFLAGVGVVEQSLGWGDWWHSYANPSKVWKTSKSRDEYYLLLSRKYIE